MTKTWRESRSRRRKTEVWEPLAGPKIEYTGVLRFSLSDYAGGANSWTSLWNSALMSFFARRIKKAKITLLQAQWAVEAESKQQMFSENYCISSGSQMQSAGGSPQPEQTPSSMGAPQVLHGVHPHDWHIFPRLKRTLAIPIHQQNRETQNKLPKTPSW